MFFINSFFILLSKSFKIYTYIEPITISARNEIKLKLESILISSTMEELNNEYNGFIALLSNKTLQNNPYVFERLQLNQNNPYIYNKINSNKTIKKTLEFDGCILDL